MRRVWWVVAGLAVVAAVGVAVAVTTSGPGDRVVIPGATFRIGSGDPGPGVSRDPALTAAAKRVTSILQSTFADSFAGLIEDQANRRLVIYRRPDPALDTRIRAEAPGIAVEYYDARYSRTQMDAFAARILGDGAYWRGRGIRVTAVVDRDTGSGVDVLVAPGAAADAERLMNEHYQAIPIRVTGST